VEDAVRCNPERGTNPKWMFQFVSGFLDVQAQFNTKQLVAPSIVLYLAESRDKESGHYGVVTFVGAEYVTIFDPFSDREYRLKSEYFEHDWQCPWYGDRWMLTAK
jgi:ABC-type bacteriocin/lantibiotic exporter with double-glycine peptidase domain